MSDKELIAAARQHTESYREALDKIVTEYDMALYTKEETLDRLYRAALPDAATEAKQPEGWSTEDRQEAKREAERRWSRPAMRYAEQRYQAGNINGFILGAEWQKARETFISFRSIADEARAERDAALEAIERVRETLMLHNPNGRLVKEVLAALDGAPEPEWEYGSGPEDALDQSGLHTSRATAERGVVEWNEFTQRSERMGGRPLERLVLVRRRKAGPWIPVEEE